MGLRLTGNPGEKCFFVTTTFWRHQTYGNNNEMYEALMDCLLFYCKKYSAGLVGYVFRPTHIHLLLHIDGRLLSGFMRDFKKFISQKASRDLGINESIIWMPRYHRISIFSNDLLRIKLQYIHNNPVKSGLVESPEEWEYSSARDYSNNGTGFIPIMTDWF